MQTQVSKSQFKAQALQFLRELERTKQPIIITHNKKPVATVIPYRKVESDEAIRESLKGSVLYYIDPDKPAIDPEDWDMLR